jgi:hypothetical protein
LVLDGVRHVLFEGCTVAIAELRVDAANNGGRIGDQILVADIDDLLVAAVRATAIDRLIPSANISRMVAPTSP